MPTKPEQADLLMVLFGRNGESPVPVVAASSPSQCFDAAIEAVRIALKYRTPVYLLSDAYLANGSEPWLIPQVDELPDISVPFAEAGDEPFEAFKRDPETLARPWAIPGTPGLEHRIGGLEKADVTGAISYDPDNHDHMVRLRAQKVAGIAADIPELDVDDPDGDAELLVIGWGSTYGPIAAATGRVRKRGVRVARAHLHHVNPFPSNTAEVLRRYPRILVPEMNLGQLAMLLRAEFLVDAVSYSRVRGRPLSAAELEDAITAMAEGS
jgi:2-oxoglutarate ferredoxin oxidoreductase subunit alpha